MSDERKLLGVGGERRAGIPVRLALLLVAVAAAGCKTHSPSQYISPQITGRVMDAERQQPIQGVQVKRVNPNKSTTRPMEDPKGGQQMEQTPAVRTAADGTFVLDSERDLEVFRKLGWLSVSVSFKHPAYEPLIKTYTLADATNTPSGEPLVKIGDIMLKALSR